MSGGWASPGQLAALAATARRRLGLRDRDARLDWCEARVGRRLDTSLELTAHEAAALLINLSRAHLPRCARPERRLTR